MDLDLMRRVRKTAAIFGGVLAIPFATYFGVVPGVGWIAGIIWSLVNLFFVTDLVKSVITNEDRNTRRIVAVLLAKFPLLYAAGLLLLTQLPAAWLMAGFTWPFFVLVMKGGGRAYMKMDDTSTLPGASS